MILGLREQSHRKKTGTPIVNQIQITPMIQLKKNSPNIKRTGLFSNLSRFKSIKIRIKPKSVDNKQGGEYLQNYQYILIKILRSQSYKFGMNPQKQLENAFALCSEHNNQQIKIGQSIIQKLQTYHEYPILLLEYLKVSPTFNGKLRSVIELKLWCERYKGMEEFEQNQYQQFIEDVKSNILLAYLSLDDKLAATLLIGINALSVVEFPDKWDGLLRGLMNFSGDHPDSTLRVLELLAQISNKYSYMTRSDPLYKEIIYFCETLHDFVLNLTRVSMDTIMANQNNQMNVKILENLMTLFYNMNYQDLPPQFQDNLNEWMNILNRVMQLPNSNQGIFKCKGAALQSILLYASKYKEDVEESIKGFSEQIWSLCANAKADPEYDDIVFNALKYFRSLILWSDMRDFFSNNISGLISNLILPNIIISKESMYSLQDDTQNFINNYFRNGQTGTRRSSALDLLKTITRNFPAFEAFVRDQIANFDISSNNLQGQCMLLTLITDCAPKAFRDLDGATQLYIDPQIISYCYSQLIKKTLNNIFSLANSNIPIQTQMNKTHLIVTLRFLFYFRVFLPTNQLSIILKLCCMVDTNEDSLTQVFLLMISSFASIRHGDFMLLKTQKYFFDENTFVQVAKDIFDVIAKIDQRSKHLNGSLTKLFFLSIKNLKTKCVDYYDFSIRPIIHSMLGKLDNYDFNTVLSLFEGISHLVYYLCICKSDKCQDLQKTIHDFFLDMIKKQSDLLNFCFQILSIFLQANPGQNKYYQDVYMSILSLDNWIQQNLSVMASYIQYITAYLGVNNNKLIEDKNVFENIFSKLIEIQHFDLFYRFLNKILKITGIQGFINSGYMEIAIKGTEFVFNKNLEGRKIGLIFIFEIAFNFNTQMVVNCINSISNGFFQRILIDNQDIIKSIQAFRSRKIMYGALCNALVSGCFSSLNSEATILNLLIENSLGRMRNFNINLNKDNKDSTYQKLQIFKQIEQQDQPISLDQDNALLQSYTMCLQRNPQLQNQIQEKNQERMKRLFDRQKNR